MEEQSKVIDFKKIVKSIKESKKLYLKILPAVFVLSCIWIFPEPRYYTSEAVLAPELGNDDSPVGSISSLASSFGINIGGAANDAIYPMLYPDLFESPEFIVSLFSIRVKFTDEDEKVIETDYYTYLTQYQKKNWLTEPIKIALASVKKIFSSKQEESYSDSPTKINPFKMSKKDFELVERVGEFITCSVDKKTDVTSITVQDQNAEVSTLMADSIRIRLQNFITDHRTAKARLDVVYYQHLADSSKVEYDRAVQKYAEYTDSHKDIILQSYISERDDLENEMSMRHETYQTLVAQLTAAKAKVQERTPVFTVLKNPTVPIKPAGPKRMLFVIGMVLLATLGITVYSLKDEIFR